MVPLPTLEQLLECGLHFGHKRSRRHPKMEPFLFTTKNDLTVIDVRKTLAHLETALAYVSKLGEEGAVLLFVGTKKQASSAVKSHAESVALPYVTNRWLGGTLTNFTVISKMIKKYHSLKEKQTSGEFQKYTKKEQLDISREIDELDVLIGGIASMTKVPTALFIVDTNHNSTAVKEARRKKIPIIALCDANVNPELVDYPIPGNDDARKGLELIIRLIADAYREGTTKRSEKKAEAELEKQSVTVTQGATL